MRITSATLPPERRRHIAVRLTDAIDEVLFDPRGRLTRAEPRERTTVHFTPYAADELFIGGQTPEARNAADVTVELSDWGMSRRQRPRIARELTPVLAEAFGVPPTGWDGINIRFHAYHPSEFAVDGHLLSDVVLLVGRMMRRMAGENE